MLIQRLFLNFAKKIFVSKNKFRRSMQETSIQYQFFPRYMGLIEPMAGVVGAFQKVEDKIASRNNDLISDKVLAFVRPHLERIGFHVEQDKTKEGKIDVPVLFGQNNSVDKFFNADAISEDGRIVIEVEAGRATENHQFLKDIFEASMMFGVEYLIIAVRNKYRTHNDFERIYAFLETMYVSNRIKLPLKGILLIGY